MCKDILKRLDACNFGEAHPPTILGININQNTTYSVLKVTESQLMAQSIHSKQVYLCSKEKSLHSFQ